MGTGGSVWPRSSASEAVRQRASAVRRCRLLACSNQGRYDRTKTHAAAAEPTAGAALVPALRRWRRPGLAIICVLAAAVLYWEITSFVAYTGDAYVTSDLVGVAPQVSGRIVAVYVRDNQVVRRGDKLVTIDKVPLELAVEVRRAALDEARAQTQADRDAVTAVQVRRTQPWQRCSSRKPPESGRPR